MHSHCKSAFIASLEDKVTNNELDSAEPILYSHIIL